MTDRPDLERSMGLAGATGVGVGAIVGGGILALTGVAFAATGPSAILAFALNGVIALVTAMSFAELATRFPESGGTYAFAKKALSIEAAFAVGWVVWFASIVASTLYAFGFGAFLLLAIDEVVREWGGTLPDGFSGRPTVVALAAVAVLVYALGMLRTRGGGTIWLNFGKVAVFAVLVAAGLWKLAGAPAATISSHLSPFFTAGGLGLVQAMGFSFIAVQGFDLIAAVAGEVREPARNIPRAMLYSLGIALAIYLPLLLVIATVGVPAGTTVARLGAEHPEAVIAVAARNFLGPFGYWLVVAAGVLSMLSALQANLLAASRVGLAMARDRTLPHWLSVISPTRRTPTAAVVATAVVVLLVLAALPDLAEVGAAASLVFLLTFAIAQRVNILARQRVKRERASSLHVPGYGVLPWIGGLACLALAVFQGVTVPTAGAIAAVWLLLGAMLYVSALGQRARTVDALSQALDAELVRLRGRSPLVLVPIANPASAEGLVGVANALAPPAVGRVLLLSVVQPREADDGDENPDEPRIANAEAVLRGALAASFARDLAPEVLTTVSATPWLEIIRVARNQRCESLLMGFNRITEPGVSSRLELILSRASCDVVVLGAPVGWRLDGVKRVLVPVGGRRMHNELRARLLGSISRLGAREITLLRVVRESATEVQRSAARLSLLRTERDEVPHASERIVVGSDDPVEAIATHAADCDLLVLGLRRRTFGELALRVAERTSCGIIMISRRG